MKDTACIQLFSFKTAFGGGRSTGFGRELGVSADDKSKNSTTSARGGLERSFDCVEGLIYESLDKMKKFEPKYRLKRARRSVSVHTGIGAEVMDLGLKPEKQNAGAVLLHPS